MAVSVLYRYPTQGLGVSGVDLPPGLGNRSNSVVVDVTATEDRDTFCSITHNWALPADELAAGWPMVILTPLTFGSSWGLAEVLRDSVKICKRVEPGSGRGGAQLRVWILRPHSTVK